MENVAAPAKSIPIERTKLARKLIFRILYLLLVAVFIVLAALSFWPAAADFHGDENTAGAGSGHGGLERPFPAMLMRNDNKVTDDKFAQRVELGRLLFFDPVVSGNNDMSCATCHHPDLGFTDSRGQSMGKGGHGVGPERAGGDALRRGSPTIWNAGFNFKQFWDGRAADLEEQAAGPITNEHEMASNPDDVVKKLRAIPEYAGRFDNAFGGAQGSSISLDSVTKAIAAFERTLTANNSTFDRFVAGDRNALTASQKRGFNLFRSGKTRCFECHGMPTFNNPDFKVIGVPDLDSQEPDYGRSEIAGGDGYKRAFKVPTLRNVVLTAPYMHNGRFTTLEQVLDFYSKGGGPGMGLATPNLDDKIRPYEITAQEKEDLIAFLASLTDESKLPAFPERVPSGLPVAPHLNNPGRPLAAKHNTGSVEAAGSERTAQTLTVKAGESIQSAVDRARPGDTIEVAPGTYHEQVTVDLDNISLRGLPGGSKPVLEGDHKLSDAVIATGNDFSIEGFQVQHYTGNGIAVQNARNAVFRDL